MTVSDPMRPPGSRPMSAARPTCTRCERRGRAADEPRIQRFGSDAVQALGRASVVQERVRSEHIGLSRRAEAAIFPLNNRRLERGASSMVEHRPFKPVVLGSSPRRPIS